jgi:hypothetical protein
VAKFKYGAYHPIRRDSLGYLDVKEPTWTEALSAGSTLTFKVTVPADPYQISQIKRQTKPDFAAIYVEEQTTGQIPWGGVVKRRDWDPDSNSYSITVVEWRSWLYSTLLSPKRDLSGDNVYVYTNQDQFAITRSLVAQIQIGGLTEGIPPIRTPITSSGVTRSLTFRGTSFQSAGAAIDSFANLDRGFDWDLICVRDADGLPILQLEQYFPQRGGYVPSLVFRVERGQLDGLTEDSTNKVGRMWAVGEGPNAESLPYALDVAPEMKLGYRLRTDGATKYSGIYNRTQLASYARAERAFRDIDLDVMTFVTGLDTPDVMSYQRGDRGRILYKDRIYSIDVAKARILEKTVSPEANQVKVTVDLNDAVAPESDPGGTV